MNRLTRFHSAIANALQDIAMAFVHLLTGYDFLIERWSLKAGPFRFSRDVHGPYDSQYFGFGYSCTVSRVMRPARLTVPLE